MQWNAVYALVLFWVTAVTYLTALTVEIKSDRRYRKAIIWICAVFALLPLAVFKYYNFVVDNVNNYRIMPEMRGLNWAVPLGISGAVQFFRG